MQWYQFLGRTWTRICWYKYCDYLWTRFHLYLLIVTVNPLDAGHKLNVRKTFRRDVGTKGRSEWTLGSVLMQSWDFANISLFPKILSLARMKRIKYKPNIFQLFWGWRGDPSIWFILPLLLIYFILLFQIVIQLYFNQLFLAIKHSIQGNSFLRSNALLLRIYFAKTVSENVNTKFFPWTK